MAETRNSVLVYDGDGSTTLWAISFAGGYISKTHVGAFTITGDGPRTPQAFTWVGDYTVKVEPAVPVGTTLTLYRATPMGTPLVDYEDSSILTEGNLDLNAKQAVFLHAELYDSLAGSGLGPGIPSYDELFSLIGIERQERMDADSFEASLRVTLEGRVDNAELGVVEAKASVIEEAFIRAEADLAEAGKREVVAASVVTLRSDTEASIEIERIARADGDAAEASARQLVAASVNTLRSDTEGWIETEQTARADGDSAEANAREAVRANLQGQINNLPTNTYVDAQVTAERNARVSADEAEAAARENVRATLKSEIDTKVGSSYVDAQIWDERVARVNADEAEAQARESVRVNLQGQVDTVSGAIDTERNARIDDTGEIRLSYGVTLNSNGEATGFSLVGGGGYTIAKWVVSTFKIVGPGGTPFEPFVVDTINNKVIMTNVEVDTLKAGSITSASLGTGSMGVGTVSKNNTSSTAATNTNSLTFTVSKGGWTELSYSAYITGTSGSGGDILTGQDVLSLNNAVAPFQSFLDGVEDNVHWMVGGGNKSNTVTASVYVKLPAGTYTAGVTRNTFNSSNVRHNRSYLAVVVNEGTD